VIYNNVREVQATYPDYFKNNVNFISVLHNLNPINELYELFLEKFDKTPLTANLDEDSVNPNFKHEFERMKNLQTINSQTNDKLVKIEKEHIVETVEDVTNFLFANSGYVKSNYIDLIYNSKNLPKYPTGTCQAFSRKLFITARGKILPCERIGHQFQFGTANKNEILLDLNKTAERYNNYFENISNQCNECYSKSSCGICMFKQNIESKDMFCTGFTDYTGIVKLFSQNLSYLEQNKEVYSKILNKISYI